MLASGVPFFAAESADRWGFKALPWLVTILVPLLFLFSGALAIFELYYQITTTRRTGKRFRRLLDSLQLPGDCRTPADIRSILKTIAGIEFLKAYPYSKLSRLCRWCELLDLKPKEAVLSEGEAGYHFFVLIKGTVDVYVLDKSPPHHLKCVNSHHDSGSFGELALIQVSSSSTTAFLCRCHWSKPGITATLIACYCSGRREAYSLHHMPNSVQIDKDP